MPCSRDVLYKSAITGANSKTDSFSTLLGIQSGPLDFLVFISRNALNAVLESPGNSLGTSTAVSKSVCRGVKCDVKSYKKVLNRSASASTVGKFSPSLW